MQNNFIEKKSKLKLTQFFLPKITKNLFYFKIFKILYFKKNQVPISIVNGTK